MNKRKALKALGGASSADQNKQLTVVKNNQKSELWQQEYQSIQAVCLVCRKPHQLTQKLAVVVFRNQKQINSFGLCQPCERGADKSIQLLRVRLDSIGQSGKRGGK